MVSGGEETGSCAQRGALKAHSQSPPEGRGAEESSSLSGAACPVEVRKEEAKQSKAGPAGSWNLSRVHQHPRVIVPESLQGS